MRDSLLAVTLFLGSLGPLCAAEQSMFAVTPMFGGARIEARFASNGTSHVFKDSGRLYGFQTLRASPGWTWVTLAHFSELKEGDEAGYLVSGSKHFRVKRTWQPLLNASLEYIHARAVLSGAGASPFLSMEVGTTVWAFYPTAGVSCKNGPWRVTPYVGYFKEAVGTTVSSEGMPVMGQTRFGFRRKVSKSLDYSSAGLKVEYRIGHFLQFDGKFYGRFRSREKNHYTTRLRLSAAVNRRWNLTAKYDDFQDRHMSSRLFLIGPSVVF